MLPRRLTGSALLCFGLASAVAGCGSTSGQPASSSPAEGGWVNQHTAGAAQPAPGGAAASAPRADAEPAARSADGSEAAHEAAATAPAPKRSSRTYAPGSHNDGKPRIAAIGPHVWIKPKPSHEGLALGNIRLGTSVRLKKTEPVPGEKCKRGWYAVEPRGYVCLNHRTTLDTTDPYFLALADVAPKPDAAYPLGYAHSRGAPMYGRVPTPQEWEKAELRFGPPGTYQELGEWAAGHEELIEKDRPIEAEDEVPWYFEGGKRHVHGGTYNPRVLKWRTIPNGSLLAYGRSFEMHGRVWLVTPDLMVVPADRVQYMRRHEFRGVDLGGEVTLPLAWNLSHDPIPIYRRTGGDGWEPSGRTLRGKGWIEISPDGDLTWEFSRQGKPKYLPLRDDPTLAVDKRDVTFTVASDKRPRAVAADGKWLEAKILPGTMTAYVGDRPVYATLFSPGKGGLPVKGLDHTIYATTQTGYFPLEWRERVATMSNEKGEPKVLWFSDVPHVQYLRAPLAMHVAYWHEDFGNKKSAECLNMSAIDGKWVFDFADPPLPEDWGAVGPGRGNGPSTPVVVRGW
jgi:hypothetical protein